MKELRLLDKEVIYNSRAPMRISFGGGGTELSPYVDQSGGCVLSATIGIYAHVSIKKNDSKFSLKITSQDNNDSLELTEIYRTEPKQVHKSFRLVVACLHYIQTKYNFTFPLGIEIVTGSEAPEGSGLGASSVLTVAILKALTSAANINLTQTELAKSAYVVERELLGLAGGLQDHYAAAFGGLNFVEFNKNKQAQVNPLNLHPAIISELESSLILLYTGTSRESAQIIEAQQKTLVNNQKEVSAIFDEIARLAEQMRIALQAGNIKKLGLYLHQSWTLKKATNENISTNQIDLLYQQALSLGAYGGKISGAGGGGFMMILCPPEFKISIARKLHQNEAVLFPSNLVSHGAQAWTS